MNCDFLRGCKFAYQNALSLAQIKQLNDQNAARNADPNGYPHVADTFWTDTEVNTAKDAQNAIQPPTQASLAAIGAYQAVLSDIQAVTMWTSLLQSVLTQMQAANC